MLALLTFADLLAQAKLGRTTASVRHVADRLLADTSTSWLQLDWTV